jgi:AcrR family transcriptional regulator
MPRKPNIELQAKITAIKRDQILDAAKAVFAEKDFHRATIKDVATRAGVADGTVYNYFENKNALILGLMDRFNQSDKRETDFAKLEPENLGTFLREYTRERFKALSSEGMSLFQAVLPEILVNQELRTLYRERIISPTFAAAESMVATIMDSSDLTHDEVMLNLQLEAAMFVGLIVLRIIGDERLEKNWEKIPDAISSLMLNAFQTKEKKS